MTTNNTNISINDRISMTETEMALRVESGAEVDPREEVICKKATLGSIFGSSDSNRASRYGEHRVRIRHFDEDKDIVGSVEIIKNGVKVETKPYAKLVFIDDETGAFILKGTTEEPHVKRFYAGMAESLRKNLNSEYDGIAEPMTVGEMLEFIELNPISIWTRWDAEYEKVELDFFDRVAWEKSHKDRAKMSATSRKASGTKRPTEGKALRQMAPAPSKGSSDDDVAPWDDREAPKQELPFKLKTFNEDGSLKEERFFKTREEAIKAYLDEKSKAGEHKPTLWENGKRARIQ